MRRRVAHNIWVATLKVKVTVWQNSFRSITLWFEVEFYNYFTGMITILTQLVTCKIWIATLKTKVTAWPCSKIVSGLKCCYLKSDFTTTFDKLLFCVQYLFREHYPVPTGSCFHHTSYSRFCFVNLYIWIPFTFETFACASVHANKFIGST